MGTVSQKCQYALRATLELSHRFGGAPEPVSEIAFNQDIPPRFLELIMVDLKKAGLVGSTRGVKGGYILVKAPESISVADVMQAVDLTYHPVDCMLFGGEMECRLTDTCEFSKLWGMAREAIDNVYSETSFADIMKHKKGDGPKAQTCNLLQAE